jgi:hypothetical protein
MISLLTAYLIEAGMSKEDIVMLKQKLGYKAVNTLKKN